MNLLIKKIEKTLFELKNWIEREEYKGYDPYDGLNSKIFRYFTKGKFSRIAIIQFFKKCPFNLRRFFMIRKDFNPKGLGLIVVGYLNLYKKYKMKEFLEKGNSILSLLIALASKGYSGYCWGYNFDWQSRAFFVPAGVPNVICTSFVADAFLEYYKIFRDEKYLNVAISSCNFIVRDLNIKETPEGICFSYTPVDNSEIHNANLLAAALLAKVFHFTKKEQFFSFSKKAANFSIKFQAQDGAWYYGNAENQKWVDNFHTGFNLVALSEIVRYTGISDFVYNIKRGVDYYRRFFFVKDVIPKYYNNKMYPIDIHSVAQSIITFIRLREFFEKGINRAIDVALWGIENMRSKEGYFYFQKHVLYTNKIPYMRWSQAWMFYALSFLNLFI